MNQYHQRFITCPQCGLNKRHYSSGVCQSCHKKNTGYVYPKLIKKIKSGCPNCGRVHPSKTKYCVDCNMKARVRLSDKEKTILELFDNEPCKLLSNRGITKTCKSCGWKKYLYGRRKCAECLSNDLKVSKMQSPFSKGEVETFLKNAKVYLLEEN